MYFNLTGKDKPNRKYYLKSDFYAQSANVEDEKPEMKNLGTEAVEIFDTEEGLMMNVKIPPNTMNTMLPLLKAKEENNAKDENITKAEDAISETKTEKSENKISGVKRKRDEEEDISNEKQPNKRQKTMTSTFLNKKTYLMTSYKRFSDLGGIGDIIEEIKKLVQFPLIREVIERLIRFNFLIT